MQAKNLKRIAQEVRARLGALKKIGMKFGFFPKK